MPGAARTASTATTARHDARRQKQVDDAIARAFEGSKHKGKCRVVITADGVWLTFFHYQHTLLVFDLVRGRPLMTWHEKPTDRRVLRAALANLEARYGAGRRGAKGWA